ncbi:MAG TPA: FAD-dependent oxidoreductase [Thermoanaerobaculia bacterium]|nr:FAD-dependent oxidoreductase [Thermoanaerobaculia bacterium]
MPLPANPLWEATSASPTFAALRTDLQADVVIVGAGITGLTAALLLAEKGRRVAVIEKETIGSGETGRTTAHLAVALDARYHYIQRHYSKEEAKLVADASRASLEKIAELVQRHSIDCRFRRVPGYLYTEKRKYVAELKNEAAAAREAGLDAQWVSEVPLPFETRGAVLWPEQAQFHPLQYLAALAKHAAAAGAQIFERTLATNVEPGAVETGHGRIIADHVFMATNVPIAGFTHVHTKTAAYRSYALALAETGAHPEGLFWDTADPYHYTRWQETDEGTFLIAGGEDHRTGEEEDTEGCFSRLADYARQCYGPHEERYRWSGQIIEPHGGLPMIGGSKEQVYISTGYAGQGMTFGTAGGMLVSDLILGVSNPWKDLFDPMRNRPHITTREFITENMHFPAHLVAGRVASANVEATSTDEVANGEGKILKVEGRKIAAFRDDAGTLHCLSPVCPHLKCDVAWNSAERTWDCPCHGSRFAPTGAVLNGPAHEPLEKF